MKEFYTLEKEYKISIHKMETGPTKLVPFTTSNIVTFTYVPFKLRSISGALLIVLRSRTLQISDH